MFIWPLRSIHSGSTRVVYSSNGQGNSSTGPIISLLPKAAAASRASISQIGSPPAASFDFAQEAFDLPVEGCWLFQVDGMPGVRTNPRPGSGAGRFQHQIGFEARPILVSDRQ